MSSARARHSLLFVVGASGAGKTAATRRLEERGHIELACHFFDSIGIPSVEDMTRVHGGPEGWQSASTREWIVRLSQMADDRIMILEGQTRPSFIQAAAAACPIDVGIVLLDCDPVVRGQRLRAERGQPELDTPHMNTWAAYLRGQADALSLPVVDTTHASLDEVADRIYEHARTLL